MKIKTSELIGAALDWAVLKCVGFPMIGTQGFVLRDPDGDGDDFRRCQPSTNWQDGGPIIEQEKIGVSYWPDKEWQAQNWQGKHNTQCGPIPLIAAMRCFVASKLGEEVDIPKELA